MTKPSSSLFANSIPYSPVLGVAFGTMQALLIQQIHYWCLKKGNCHDGEYWVYKTYKEWATEIAGFDTKTIQRALESLRSSGVVVVGHYNKFKYDRTLWYRLDYHRLTIQINLKQSQRTFCLNPSGQFDHSLSDILPSPIPETTQETTAETTAVDFATGKAPRIKIKLGKQTTTDMELQTMKQPTSSSAILHGLKVANGTAPSTANTSKSLQHFWRRLVPKHHPTVGMMPELTTVQKGQLSHIAKALGAESDRTIQYVVPHWIGFCNFVASQAGLKKTPDVPQIGFLLKHITEAVNYAKEGMQLTAPKKNNTKIVSFVKPPLDSETTFTKPEVPETLEDGDEMASADFMLNWKPPSE